MAFEETKGRYASFGTVTALPGSIIDNIWYIIDNYLKNVIPLKKLITFEIKKNPKGKINITFSQENQKGILSIDFNQQYDPFYPRKLVVIDRNGQETILLPDELGII